jgi:hypothetical protein
MVWHCSWGRCDRPYLTAQGFDNAPGGNVLRAPEHDIEHLATLIVTGFRVGTAVNSLQVPLSILEPQSIILVLLRVHLLFALSLAGRRTIFTLLLLL